MANMEADAIKVDLIDKIEHADVNQLKQLYGLVINYFNGQETEEDWDTLTEIQQDRINKSIEQANSGLGTPASEVIKRAKERHGLDD